MGYLQEKVSKPMYSRRRTLQKGKERQEDEDHFRMSIYIYKKNYT